MSSPSCILYDSELKIEKLLTGQSSIHLPLIFVLLF